MLAEEARHNQDQELLRLQHMESHLIRSLHHHPHAMSARAENQLRYALNFARLTAFEPGAAEKGGRSGRGDVTVTPEPVLDFRNQLVEALGETLRPGLVPDRRIREAAQALPMLMPSLKDARRKVLAAHADDFTERELDAEIGTKTLVSVAGGGGGAGYVYIGAWETLEAAGYIPGYVIGASIGAVIGLFRARKREGDYESDIRLAKSMNWDNVFRMVSLKTRYGLPGLMRLFMHAALDERFRREDGQLLRLPDLEIPYEAIVAGVTKGAFPGTPDDYAREHHLVLTRRPGRLKMSRMVAEQLVRMVAFFNPMIVKEIVIGGDELTSSFDAIDAAGFSAAIPGIIHYDVAREDPHMHRMLDELFEREGLACLVDGGVANNVPARTAWRQVQAGKIGTRNCYYLGFDCFHPQWGIGHVWLQGVTRLIQVQVALNSPYAHHIVKFSPTLSPTNLLPGPEQLDTAVSWGREKMSRCMPVLEKFFEPVKWVE